MFRRPIDGDPKATQIAQTQASEFPSSVTPDGLHLMFTRISAGTAGDIGIIPLSGGTPKMLIETPTYEGGASLSPDSRWMVYVSNELGSNEIFVRPYPALDRRFQVSSAGGIQPTWNPKGGEIFYRSGDSLMSVKMTVTPAGPSLTPPVPLFTGRYAYGGGLTIPNYTVMSDGDHFVMVKEQSGVRFNVVLNWFEELRRATSGK